MCVYLGGGVHLSQGGRQRLHLVVQAGQRHVRRDVQRVVPGQQVGLLHLHLHRRGGRGRDRDRDRPGGRVSALKALLLLLPPAVTVTVVLTVAVVTVTVTVVLAVAVTMTVGSGVRVCVCGLALSGATAGEVLVSRRHTHRYPPLVLLFLLADFASRIAHCK
jgi:hypothetical protein